MFEAFPWCQNDRAFEFLSVVSIGVSVTSGAAWFVSRHLRNAALRHLVLFSALVSCLAIPTITSLRAGAELTFVSIPVPSAEEQGMVPQQDGNGSACACATSCQSSTSRYSHLDQPADPNVVESLGTAAFPIGLATTLSGQPSSGTPATWHEWLREVATVGLLVWAVGTLFRLARFLGHCGCVVQLRRSSRPVQIECQTLLREVADQLGVRRVPALLVSSRSISPLAVGLGRPAVILPERVLSALTDAELRDVLAHEVAHLRRGDQWIVLLQELVAALYWPIMFVHALNRELWRAREELCDNLALSGRDPISYSETLYQVAELLVQHRPVRGTVGMLGGRGELERRIAGLVDPNRSSSAVISRMSVCVVACLFTALSLTTAGTRFVGTSEPVPPATPLFATPDATGSVPPAQAAGTTGPEIGGDLSSIACCPS